MSARVDVWNVRRVRVSHLVGAPGAWLYQPAAYARQARKDGLQTWVFVYGIGQPLETEEEALAAGAASFGAVPRDPEVGHGKLALRLGDLLAPDEESEFRLGGDELYRLFYVQTRGGRYKLALGRRGPSERTIGVIMTGSGHPKGGAKATKVYTEWLLVRRIGLVTEKQLPAVHQVGLRVERAIKIPRDAGKVIK